MHKQNLAMDEQQIENMPDYQDEINLYELWSILVKRKWQVLVIVFLATALSSAYAFLAKPVYQASGLVRLGGISGRNGSLIRIWETPTNVAVMIRELDRNVRVTIPKAGTKEAGNLIRIIVEGNSSESAEARLRSLVKILIKKHDLELNAFKKMKMQEIKDIEKTISILEQKCNYLEDSTSKMMKNPGNVSSGNLLATIAILKLETIKEQKNILGLQNTLSDLKESISPVFLKPTVLINVNSSTQPIKPKKKFVIAAGITCGWVLGVLVAFCVEFLKMCRRKDVSTLKSSEEIHNP